ncbi:MAG: amidohydrolase family protein [Pirellulales bacterium]
MPTTDIQAIDVHGHYGDYYRDQGPLEINKFLSADALTVARRARQANISTTIVSPLSGLLPRGRADVVAANKEAAETIALTEGLMQWVIVHPLQPQTYQQAAEMLSQPQCVGIKLHPEEHEYPISEHGEALFEFAAQHQAVVLVHSGDANSSPSDFLPLANTHPEVKLILAHLGNGGAASGDPTLQVRAIQASSHGNVYVDTSSARSLTPGLIEWAVGEIGAERILFGTDTPLYFTAMQRARIDQADITDEDKRRILYKNAQRLIPELAIEKEAKSC